MVIDLVKLAEPYQRMVEEERDNSKGARTGTGNIGRGGVASRELHTNS